MYTKYAKLRDERGMTDNAVAVATGIKQSTFYDWKQRAERDPDASMSIDRMSKIAKYFDVPLDYFKTED